MNRFRLWLEPVSPRDLSRIQVSFLTMNGLVSLALATAAWISLAVRG